MLYNKRNVVFTLNDDTNQVVMRPWGSVMMDQIHCCDVARIYFVHDGAEYVLFNSRLPFYHEPLNAFNDLIFKAIAGELTLPKLFTKDIGYIFNEYEIKRHCNRYSASVKIDENFYFSNYQLCRTSSRTTWLYNDHEGSIVLEITPNYPWDAYSKRTKCLITLKRFLKNYKNFYRINTVNSFNA